MSRINNADFYDKLRFTAKWLLPCSVVRHPHECAGERSNCRVWEAARHWTRKNGLRFHFFHEGNELWAVKLPETT